MISAVNPYGVAHPLINQGNASLDFLALDLVVKTTDSLKHATGEFLNTFDVHKFYTNMQNIGKGMLPKIDRYA